VYINRDRSIVQPSVIIVANTILRMVFVKIILLKIVKQEPILVIVYSLTKLRFLEIAHNRRQTVPHIQHHRIFVYLVLEDVYWQQGTVQLQLLHQHQLHLYQNVAIVVL
jgi:hypothetical protein